MLAVFVLPVSAGAMSVQPPGAISAQSQVSVSQSATNAQLQLQVQALLAQIKLLQQQVTVNHGGTPAPATWCYNFGANLEVGSTGADVSALQQALVKDGESVSVSGSFDEQTASAVSGFQQKYASQVLTPNGLQFGTGYAGRATRAKLNALYGCGVPTPAPVSTPTPIIGPTPIWNQAPSFTVSQTSVSNGGSLTFSWSVPTARSFTQPSFTINPCPAGITMYDMTNGKTFLCGDLGRTVSWSGSDAIQFTNTSDSPVQMFGQLDYGAAMPLQRYFTVAENSSVSPALSIVNVSGLQGSYMPNQPISFMLDGVQLPSNAPADSNDGFNVQAYMSANGGLTNVSGVNGLYNSNTGLWAVTLLAPSSTGAYNLSASLYCGNTPCSTQYPNGSDQVSKNFAVAISTNAPPSLNGPAPTVTLLANPTTISSNQSTTLSWSSTNATFCIASGGSPSADGTGWAGTGYPSQTVIQEPSVTTTYGVTCTGPGGSTSASATVTVQ